MLILTVFFVYFCVILCSPGSFKHHPTFKRKFHVKEKFIKITSDYLKIAGTEGTRNYCSAAILFMTRPQYKERVSWKCRGKGKGIPLHAWTGPEGSRRLRPQDFKTTGT
jgi:hypothetical protein